MPDKCTFYTSGHQWISGGASPKHEARGHRIDRICRGCHATETEYLPLLFCCRCAGDHVPEALIEHYWETRMLEHVSGKGHGAVSHCVNCGEVSYSSGFEKLPGCPRCVLPSAPAFTGPEQGAVLATAEVTLAWGAVPGATHYVLQLKDLTAGRVVDGFPMDVHDTRLTVPAGVLAHGHGYAAEVAAVSDMDGPKWGSPRPFEIAAAPTLAIEDIRVTSTEVSATVEWRTARPASARIHANGQWYDEPPADDPTQHTVEVAGLTPGEPCSAVIESRDGPSVGTVRIEIPRILAIRTEMAAGEAGVAVTIFWRTNYESYSLVSLDEDGTLHWYHGAPSPVLDHVVTIDGCVPGRRYSAMILSQSVDTSLRASGDLVFEAPLRLAPPPGIGEDEHARPWRPWPHGAPRVSG